MKVGLEPPESTIGYVIPETGNSGAFIRDCDFELVQDYPKNPEMAECLWKLSESLVGSVSTL